MQFQIYIQFLRTNKEDFDPSEIIEIDNYVNIN